MIRNILGLPKSFQLTLIRKMSGLNFETLAVTNPRPFVFHVELNRPEKLNALNKPMWIEFGQCFRELNENKDCRSIVLTGAGKHFNAGIDLQVMIAIGEGSEDVGRKGLQINKSLKFYQDSISSLELCTKPVIGASHLGCIGAGVDLFSTVDIRFCTKDAWFQVKEVGIGMAADVGTLQRLPKAIGNQGLARELCFTARKFHSEEALSCGFVTKVFDTKKEMVKAALELAEEIAQKSPVAVQATKKSMVYSLDHTNQEGLDQIRDMNALLLQSEDFINAVMAQATKGEKPTFDKL